MQLLPAAEIDAPPSITDGAGMFYTFLILRHHDDHDDDAEAAKYGRTKSPPDRQRQWERQCPGQVQRWRYYWKVPYAKKFGASFSFIFVRG
jgi:hypothetical protein